MIRLLTGSVIVLSIVALCFLTGCGGGGGGDKAATGQIDGTVVKADDSATGLPDATVEARNATGDVLATATTDGTGHFLLDGVPAGDVVLFADTPNDAVYGSQQVPAVQLTAGQLLHVVIAIPHGTHGARIEGRVVRADNPTSGLGRATLEARSASGSIVSATADALGNFVLDGIPVGDVTLFADTPNEGDYGSQEVPGIHLAESDDVQVTVTILPLGTAAPTQLFLTPTQVTIDLLGQVQFLATVMSGGTNLDVTPSFLLTDPIGIVGSNGAFRATQVGSGQLVAVCGTARATADITVTPPRDPVVTSYFVSPLSLPSGGGNVTITVVANDGDGISYLGLAQVVAEVYQPPPDTSFVEVLMPQDTGTEGTFRNLLPYHVPANSNTIDGAGHQDPQSYPIRVRVRDGAGNVTFTDFLEVVVKGVDSPPGP